MTQEEVPPPPSTNQDANIRAGVNENESQDRNWNTDSNEENQRPFINGPTELARISDWESKQKSPESSEIAENWSNRKERMNYKKLLTKEQANKKGTGELLEIYQDEHTIVRMNAYKPFQRTGGEIVWGEVSKKMGKIGRKTQRAYPKCE
ncbi:hypothetical protein CEXT_195421 [Caerostris extrusa]|uniref:Uncharacterized protein n=1 Tax=Caerostris extrusa TaxID=172846 RepID=A0AAV4UXS9_CAEEX|nr:hypothetical protein CEXT_195421 [Caerostris extrusa]